ncbi:late competence protein ComER [Bacillus sp. H-16]|uniref:late competence protein ComER n=1 Tax=Alteribacter salitolerans TaxID=2912333 RepID=UPI0019656613|nr:late competence protein ComER [Alteribacter salitolerans]MBM7097135.1 late competence protein ComER [Alteribacter salitolerans]
MENTGEREGLRLRKIGFIGTGSMGRILIEAILESKAALPTQMTIHNRTIEKACAIAEEYKGITVSASLPSLIKKCDWIFLCVKPLQMIPILKEYKDYLTPEKTLISITSPLSLDQLEGIVNCQTVRFIPSIVNRAGCGPSLITYGTSSQEDQKKSLREFLSCFSSPLEIDESITRVSSDIASCGPAFISFLVEKLIEAAVAETTITKEEATYIAENMLIGYGALLQEKLFTLSTLQKRVTVPGGVTGEGLKVLNEETGDMFHKLFVKTHEKFDEDKYFIQKQLEKEQKGS